MYGCMEYKFSNTPLHLYVRSPFPIEKNTENNIYQFSQVLKKILPRIKIFQSNSPMQKSFQYINHGGPGDTSLTLRDDTQE